MSHKEKKNTYREIITKAVCGKGSRFSEATHTICPSHKPSSILGCWIINHKYSAEKDGDSIEVKGSYDINVWYSYSKNTKTDVASQNVTYTDVIPLTMIDENILSDDMDVIARTIQQPNTLEATISENSTDVEVRVEREFAVECVGETKISVCVQEERHDSYDDDYADEVSEDEYRRLDPNFLHGGF
ncbi:outer spore coat protein CotE [bacterium LRH843]|nr:outer spore coat protein CotE [bacterium LRH843]